MFGTMNEAKAKCGHFVVWDTKAPQTTHWSVQSVESALCLQCQIDTIKTEYEHALSVARAFNRHP